MISAKKRACSGSRSSGSMLEFTDNEDEVEVEVKDGVEGPFAHGQHVILGTGRVGGPGGVRSGREEGGNLSCRRDLDTRDKRGGTKRKPSSWGRGGLSRKSGRPTGWM